MRRYIYRPRLTSPFTARKYGLLYNWYAATSPQTIKYGYLYNYYATTNANNIAASGWHSPSYTDWGTMITYLGYNDASWAYNGLGGQMKEIGTTYWNSPNTGAVNNIGFNFRGTGARLGSNGTFTSQKTYGASWRGLLLGTHTSFWMDNTTSQANTGTANPKDGYCVRLIKDSTSLTHGQTGTYTGNDGRVYATICIGTQEWLSENLAETKYRNGDVIPEVTSNTAWAALSTGGRCSYNNTETNVGVGYAISSSDDWVVPSQTQWVDFFDTLDTYEPLINGWPLLGTKLRESGWNHWYEYYDEEYGIEGTNDYGLTLRGGGARTPIFYGLKSITQIWSSSYNSGNPYAVYTSYMLSEITDSNGVPDYGYSIRLLYTGAGTPTSYVGNDGRTYPVVQIGSQYWLAANLAETKYRDGSYISGYDGGVYTPISELEWGALTTGALCAYNDDTNNI